MIYGEFGVETTGKPYSCLKDTCYENFKLNNGWIFWWLCWSFRPRLSWIIWLLQNATHQDNKPC